jgi:hypothetical protein
MRSVIQSACFLLVAMAFQMTGCSFKKEFHIKIHNLGSEEIDSSEFNFRDDLFIAELAFSRHQWKRLSGIYLVPPRGKVDISWTVGEHTTRRRVPIEGEYGSEPNNLLRVYISTKCGRARVFWANDDEWDFASQEEESNYPCNKFSDTEIIDAPQS